MIVTKIRFRGPLGDLAKQNRGRTLRLGGIGSDKYAMYSLGKVGISSIKARVAKGVGSTDAPMKPLTSRYAKFKQRIGKSGIRDLYGPGAKYYQSKTKKGDKVYRKISSGLGHMIDAFTLRYADARSVVMDISVDWARQRARANEQRAPWYGFSHTDTRAVFAAALKIFKGNVADLAVRIVGGKRNSSPIWMDPLGLRESKDRAA